MYSRILPSITVVIPVLDEEDYISTTLTQLLKQDYPRGLLEIIVVDGGSLDGTINLVEQYIGLPDFDIKLLHNPSKLSSYARNIGILAARSEYVLFLDAHVHIPSSTLLMAMASAVRRWDVDVLARPQPLTPPGINVLQQTIAAVRKSPIGHSRESFIYSDIEGFVSPLSVGVMYRRSIFSEFGLFDETFDAAEDVEMNYRLEMANIQAFISPDFAVHYYPRKGLWSLFKQMQRYGTGRVRFARKHPGRMGAELFVPLLIPLLILICISFYFTSDLLRPAVIFSAASGLLLIMSVSTYHSIHRHPLNACLAPVCFLTIHLGLAWGIVKTLTNPLPNTRESGMQLLPEFDSEQSPETNQKEHREN